jgi:hypothetical protein
MGKMQMGIRFAYVNEQGGLHGFCKECGEIVYKGYDFGAGENAQRRHFNNQHAVNPIRHGAIEDPVAYNLRVHGCECGRDRCNH